MLDLHVCYDATGSTSLTNIMTTANIPANDAAATGGIPPGSTDATLVMWGSATLIADTLLEEQLICQDMWDPINGEDFPYGSSGLLGIGAHLTNLPYETAARQVKQSQNTGANKRIGYTIDHYNSGFKLAPNRGSWNPPKKVTIEQTFGGALTAGVWGTQTLSPTNVPKDGNYALLGFYASALTNYAMFRFQHASFGSWLPGFPALDQFNTAVANAVLSKEDIMTYPGFQFVRMSETTKQPQCPVFKLSAGSTGLTLQALALTADTPRVIVNLMQVD